MIDITTGNLITSYTETSNPALKDNGAVHSFIDERTGYLYVSQVNAIDGGLSVIDTNTNTLLRRYDTYSNPALPDNSVSGSFIDQDANKLFVFSGYSNGAGGLTVISLDDAYTAVGESNSSIYKVENLVDGKIVVGGDIPDNTSVSVQYRTIEPNQAWFDDFDDDNSYDLEYCAFQDSFQDISVTDGIISMSNPEDTYGAWPCINTHRAEDFFPASSIIQSRLKTNTGYSDIDVQTTIFTDQWETDYIERILPTNEWKNLTLMTSVDPFSYVSFYLWLKTSDPWIASDAFQIDWIGIIPPDAWWSDWSEPCSDRAGCEINPSDLEGKEFIQFRLNLSTEDYEITPTINSLAIATTTGEYASSIIDSNQEDSQWQTLESEADVPVGTEIVFYTRTGTTAIPDDSWSVWQLVDSTITSPDARYLQYKAVLTSTKADQTPTLRSVTVAYKPATSTPIPTPTPSSSSSSVKTEVIQIPGAMKELFSNMIVASPIKDSNTKGQTVLTIIFPDTFNFNAYLSANHTSANKLASIRAKLKEESSNVKTNPGNLLIAGFLGQELMGFKQKGTIYWQVGSVQQLFYKAYPAEGKDAPMIIPELQDKPSIIALKYNDHELIPPGEPNTKFNKQTLKLAHSLDGINWQIIPSSVVDTANNTVAAIAKVAGYYTIVGRY